MIRFTSNNCPLQSTIMLIQNCTLYSDDKPALPFQKFMYMYIHIYWYVYTCTRLCLHSSSCFLQNLVLQMHLTNIWRLWWLSYVHIHVHLFPHDRTGLVEASCWRLVATITRNGMEWNGLFHSILFQIHHPKTILNLSILYLSLDPKNLRCIFLTLNQNFLKITGKLRSVPFLSVPLRVLVIPPEINVLCIWSA